MIRFVVVQKKIGQKDVRAKDVDENTFDEIKLTKRHSTKAMGERISLKLDPTILIIIN